MEPQNTQNTQKKTFPFQEEDDVVVVMEPQNTQNVQTKPFPLQKEGYSILGAVFEVYKEMGSGFLEVVYQECMEQELELRAIPYTPQPALTIAYKGQSLRQTYRPDFIYYDQIVLELKAVTQLAPEHRAQLHNYLKVTGFDSRLSDQLLPFPQGRV